MCHDGADHLSPIGESQNRGLEATARETPPSGVPYHADGEQTTVNAERHGADARLLCIHVQGGGRPEHWCVASVHRSKV